MLELTVESKELYDSESNRFITTPSFTLTLEHSLISLSKWESKWMIPYLNGLKKTPEQDLDYIRCMIVGPNKYSNLLSNLSVEEMKIIQEYIESPMTATTFPSSGKKSSGKKEIMTSEVMYARMFSHSIPIECEKWHLNRLSTLIKVCDLKSAPPEKMSKKQTAEWMAEQNAIRQAKYNTKG